MRMEFLWLALIVVFAVIEGATTALTTVWFIGGALAALAAALLHAELWLQITLFFAVSVVLLAALRPLVKKVPAAAHRPHERRREHRPRGHRHGGHRQSA